MAFEQITTILCAIVPFIVLFLTPMIKSKKHDENTIIIFMFAVSLVVLLGFRDSGGADDISVYKLYFDNGYTKEPIFNLIVYFVRAIGFNYKGLFLCYSILTAIFVFLALKNCDFEKYDLLLYISAFYFLVFPNVLTIMRQALAASILFYLHTCKNVTWKKRIVMWGLIVCTHYGFLIVIPVDIFLLFFKNNIKTVSKILIPIVGFVIGEFVDLKGAIQKATEFLGLFAYMNTDENYNPVAGLGEVIYIIFMAYMMTNILDGISKNKSENSALKEKSQVFQMLYFSFLFVTINMRWGNRISYYFVFFVPFIVNNMLTYFNVNGSKKPLKITCTIGLYTLFVLYMLTYIGPSNYQFSLLFT